MKIKRYKKRVERTILPILFFTLCLLTSCMQKGKNTGNSMPTKDMVKGSIRLHPDTSLNDEAKFVAGISVSNKSKELKRFTHSPFWREHQQNMNRIWNLYQQTSPKLTSFAQNELEDINQECGFAFYPFSGPDFLFVNALFPKMRTYLLVGLEKLGEPIKIKNPSTDTYKLYENAVSGIFNLSFFSTEDMHSKNSNDTISGVIPIIQLLMVRSGKNIVSIKYKKLTATGVIVEGSKQDNLVEIKFYKQGSSLLQTLYYLSRNLENKSFQSHSGLRNLLKRNQSHQIVCFTKSASYLMHNDTFSNIRSFILNTSNAIVQDDSGIPWSYISPLSWNFTLYGDYHSPIREYADYEQDDLEEAYQKADSRILNFRIGFNRQSNLQVIVHKK
jgi:hypothetical protein